MEERKEKKKDHLDLEIAFGIKSKPTEKERKFNRAMESSGLDARRRIEKKLQGKLSPEERRRAKLRLKAIKSVFKQD